MQGVILLSCLCLFPAEGSPAALVEGERARELGRGVGPNGQVLATAAMAVEIICDTYYLWRGSSVEFRRGSIGCDTYSYFSASSASSGSPSAFA